MTPRILNSFDNLGSARTLLMTDPPWLPVAPKTTKILLMVALYSFKKNGLKRRLMSGLLKMLRW